MRAMFIGKRVKQTQDNQERSEPSNKNRSRVPKNHPLTNVIGNCKNSMVIRRKWIYCFLFQGDY